MNKIKRLKMSREERSRINRANAQKSVARRKMMGWIPKRGKHHPGYAHMPLKHVAMYTADFIIYHRYASMMKMTKLDLMHELIVPLKAKLGDQDGVDAWSEALRIESEPEEY